MADPTDEDAAAQGDPAEKLPAGDAGNPYRAPNTGERAAGATSIGYGSRRDQLLAEYPWVGYVLPLVVFMVVGMFEPKASDVVAGSLYYPILYSIKIALTVAAIGFVWPVYRQFPFRVSPLAVVVGVVGVVAWIGICKLDLERKWIQPIKLVNVLGLSTEEDRVKDKESHDEKRESNRPGYDPFTQLKGNPVAIYSFLAVRFFGLAIVIAVVEEFFLRGFLMRFFLEHAWWEVPFGKVNAAALAIGTLVPVLMHPAELFAAAAWFSMVTCLMVTTRNIWDCVTAHSVTNLLLGVYVVWSGDSWHLW